MLLLHVRDRVLNDEHVCELAVKLACPQLSIRHAHKSHRHSYPNPVSFANFLQYSVDSLFSASFNWVWSMVVLRTAPIGLTLITPDC